MMPLDAAIAFYDRVWNKVEKAAIAALLSTLNSPFAARLDPP
jgi:hypothetical protein